MEQSQPTPQSSPGCSRSNASTDAFSVREISGSQCSFHASGAVSTSSSSSYAFGTGIASPPQSYTVMPSSAGGSGAVG